MKKLLAITIICATLLSLSSCGEPEHVYANVENSDILSGNLLGIDALVEIGNCLYYDSTTRIAYWWNGCPPHSSYATTPTPYYSANGLPYRYNPETNSFEEIER